MYLKALSLVLSNDYRLKQREYNLSVNISEERVDTIYIENSINCYEQRDKML